jgi:hypothetical protein
MVGEDSMKYIVVFEYPYEGKDTEEFDNLREALQEFIQSSQARQLLEVTRDFSESDTYLDYLTLTDSGLSKDEVLDAMVKKYVG